MENSESEDGSISSAVRTPGTPVNFQIPPGRGPETPKSNFIISPPMDFGDSSSDGEDNDVEVGVGARHNRPEAMDEDLDLNNPFRTPESARNNNDVDESDDIESLFGNRSSVLGSILRTRRLQHEGRTADTDDGLNDSVLAAVWASGKLGVAYYQLDSAELFIFSDTAESAPDFSILRSIFKQVLPRYLIMNARQDERLLNVAKELCGENITADNEDPLGQLGEQSQRTASSTLVTLQGKFFAPDNCKQRVLATSLPYERKDNTVQEHELFIASLMPIRSETMIRAAGALLQFLDKRAIELFHVELKDSQIPVLDIKLSTMEDMVIVDETAWQSLQIFSVDIHPSVAKQGSHSGSKEGVSVFSTLNQYCCTMQGAKALRMMLLRPSRNLNTIYRRHDVIDYCSNTQHLEFIKASKDCLKSIKSLPKLLYKLTLLHATVQEWKDLYQSLYHCLLIGEIASSQPQSIDLFRDLACRSNLDVLKALTQEMLRVIDFDDSKVADRIVARPGIDPLLDTKKQQYSCLPEIMALVAREEITNLPDYIQRCCMVYIPEVGYLLALAFWREGLTTEDFDIEGLEYKFRTNDLAYYKSPRAKELDTVLGDCMIWILEKETSIMIYLTECVLQNSALILRVGSLVSELDCLISMAEVAKSNNFVRPVIVPGDQRLEIVKGRHPLVEQMCNFVPNTTKLGPGQKIVIITGPNASGKSVYLKQIGIIVIMALSGSFVPASSAVIPLYDRICTRIHATESLSTGFSSFMVDLNQMSLALRTTSNQSLVLIDEFGKGTAEADGLSLLVASIHDFVQRKHESPTVILSTHFYSMIKYLEKSKIVKFQSTKYLEQRNSRSQKGITYLYELVDGRCPSSFAHIVAEQNGIPKTMVDRSLEICEKVIDQVSEEHIEVTKHPKRIDREDTLIQIAEYFINVPLENVDPTELITALNEIVKHQEGPTFSSP